MQGFPAITRYGNFVSSYISIKIDINLGMGDIIGEISFKPVKDVINISMFSITEAIIYGLNMNTNGQIFPIGTVNNGTYIIIIFYNHE